MAEVPKVSAPALAPQQSKFTCPPVCPSYATLMIILFVLIIIATVWIVWSWWKSSYTKPGFFILPKKCDKSADCQSESAPPGFMCCNSKCKSGIKNATSGVYECPEIGIP